MTIAWDDVRARLARRAAALEDVEERSRERVLASRAAALARPIARSAASGESGLAFRRAERSYAVPLAAACEVHAPRRIVPVPGTSQHWVGLVAIRGDVIPVLDVPVLLDGARPDAAPTRVVVLDDPAARLALAADDLDGAIDLAPGDLTAPLATFAGAKVTLVRAVARGGVLVLDPSALIRAAGPRERGNG